MGRWHGVLDEHIDNFLTSLRVENQPIMEVVMQPKLFTVKDFNRICRIMESTGVIPEDKFSALAYYMMSLSETHSKVFNELLPRLLAILEENKVDIEKLDALIFDLRYVAEEFVSLTDDSGLLKLSIQISDDYV